MKIKEVTGDGQVKAFFFGNVKRHSNPQRILHVEFDNDIKSFSVSPSCGSCTKVSHEKISDKEFEILLEYDTSILGNINKSIYIYYREGDNKNLKREKVKFYGSVNK